MFDLLKELISAPAANILIVIGAAFVFIAVVGNIAGKIEPGKFGRVFAAAVGIPLILIGVLVQLPKKNSPTQGQSPASSDTSAQTGGIVSKPPNGVIRHAQLQPSTHTTTSAGQNFANTIGPVFQNGNPLPIALRKWPLKATNYSQMRFSWSFPGSQATFSERVIHVPDLGHRLFTAVNFVFAPGGDQAPLVRVEATFRDRTSASYVRDEAVRRLGAPNQPGDISWQNSGGGRSAINMSGYMIDVSKF